MTYSPEKYGLIDETHLELYEQLLREYGQGTVLELGCAHPDILEAKKDLVGTLIGVDNLKDWDEAGIVPFMGHSLPQNISFVPADATQLPFTSNSVDLALLIGIYSNVSAYNGNSKRVTHGISDPEESGKAWISFLDDEKDKLVQETARVVRPNGKMILTGSLETQSAPPDKASEHFERQGFNTESYIGEERYLLVGTKID